MTLGLIHNVDAGDAGDLSALLEAIARHGHDVTIVGAPAHGVEHLLTRQLDAVVAAGGDGTIASVALALRGSPVPLAVLPMGRPTTSRSAWAYRAGSTRPSRRGPRAPRAPSTSAWPPAAAGASACSWKVPAAAWSHTASR